MALFCFIWLMYLWYQHIRTLELYVPGGGFASKSIGWIDPYMSIQLHFTSGKLCPAAVKPCTLGASSVPAPKPPNPSLSFRVKALPLAQVTGT